MDEITIESPLPDQRVYDEAITVSGRIASAETAQSVSVWSGGQLLGSTRLISPGGQFRLLARFHETMTAEAATTLQVRIDSRNGDDVAVDLAVIVVPARLDQRAYGEVVPPERGEVLHRENIYGSGPPVEHPSAEAAALVLQSLAARSSVLDLGCGAGAYGPPLISAGHTWLGAEVDPACHRILETRRLPFRAIEKIARLPFADREFDAAIAIEVLEHVTAVDGFIAEAARVTRSRFIVSVPNIEVLPYFAPLGIVPWHLLEATHVNFFTRASVRAVLAAHFARVEVFSYGEHPVRTPDGIALHVHLFAIAEH
jgi:SAM-dependent methyltransferase